MRLLVVVSVLALCGCVGGDDIPVIGHKNTGMLKDDPSRFDGKNATSSTEKVDPAACEGKETKFKDLCYVNAASKLADLSLCDRVEKQSSKELCMGRVGVATDNPKLCDRISDPSVRSQCHLAIIQKNS